VGASHEIQGFMSSVLNDQTDSGLRVLIGQLNIVLFIFLNMWCISFKFPFILGSGSDAFLYFKKVKGEIL